MNSLDAIKLAVDLLKALAWPVASVVIVILLRSKLVQLLDRIQDVSAVGVKASFRSNVAEAQESLIQSNEIEEVDPKQEPQIDPIIIRKIESDPVEAISIAWFAVQEEIVEIGQKCNINTDRRQIGITISNLCKKNIISEEFANSLSELRKTYKSVVHSYEMNLERKDVEKYIGIAGKSLAILTKIRKNLK